MELTSSNLNELRKLISLRLDPLIEGEVILTDLPYHKNIGDILIWGGEIEYLKHRKIKCLSQTSFHTFNFPVLPDNVTILLHGGGNFGDLYRVCQDFRLKVIQTYPKNKIVMFPQSSYYRDLTLMRKDAQIFAQHKSLYLCARDRNTFSMMKETFSNHILLVPDMALFLDCSMLRTIASSDNTEFQGKKVCWIKRKDTEYRSENEPILNTNLVVSDWPTFERTNVSFWVLEKLLGIQRRIKFKCIHRVLGELIDYYAGNYIRPYAIKLGCQFINQFSEVISSRLHGMILALLLSKSVIYQDNISCKLSSFCNTWFTCDSDIIK